MPVFCMAGGKGFEPLYTDSESYILKNMRNVHLTLELEKAMQDVDIAWYMHT